MRIIENIVPINVNNIASCAFPSSKSLCAGKRIFVVFSEGNPKKTEGIESKKR